MIPEDAWEEFMLNRLYDHGWETMAGKDVAPGAPDGRVTWADPVIRARASAAVRKLNPTVPGRYLEEALKEVLATASSDALHENFRFHQALTDGYRGISYVDSEGIEQNPTIRLMSSRVKDNDYLAVNQVTIRDRDHERRFDIVLYVNGFPLVLVELKRAGSESATIADAHAQLQTYLQEFPDAFTCPVLSVISNGLQAEYGTPFTPLNHFSPWNVDDDGVPVPLGADPKDDNTNLPIEVLTDGLFNQERFNQIVKNYVSFSQGADGLVKRVAKPHQYFAVTKAVGNTVDAVRNDGKVGVVWHTQGSGKSMEMELYAHLVAGQPELKNPTLVVVTDRTELDSQLFDGFASSQLLGESPIRIETRSQLREQLSVRATGGIFFTTLQKFGLTKAERDNGLSHPRLSERHNIIVIVDEAHRSHYDNLDGYARHIRDALPHASFIAFTGTPISFADRNTEAVFGPIIDTYDLTRAVEDGATVPVIYEPRLVSMGLGDDVSEDDLNNAADEATVGLDDVEREKVERSVAVINAVYGDPKRLKVLARDIVSHWKVRSEAMRGFLSTPGHPTGGKAMIVCATREICARLYKEIIALEPSWEGASGSAGVDDGKVKVVYSSDATDQGIVTEHRRRQAQNQAIQNRLRDPDDELELVIVKDMMLTGFDAPPLHTLYVDRPLKGALLMQTLARVNRTFRDKPAGLLVAYAPITQNLQDALAEYTETDQRKKPVGRDTTQAQQTVRQVLAELDTLCAGFDWRTALDEQGNSVWIRTVLKLTNYLRKPANQHVAGLGAPDRGNADDKVDQAVGASGLEGEESSTPTLAGRFRERAGQLARAWALAGGDLDQEKALTRDVRFYEEVRVWMAKYDAQERQAEGQPVPEDVERLLASLMEGATQTGEVIDIYALAGLETQSITELAPELRKRVEDPDQAHLAIEELRNELVRESDRLTHNNLTRQKAFAERIKELMNRYTNQQLTSAEVMAELIAMAKDVAAEATRGDHFDPPLAYSELAFYDALADNESAVELQGDDVLAQIARELVKIMNQDVKTDWTVRDDVRAKLRSSVKILLAKYKYPPDRRKEAMDAVIDQMEQLAKKRAQ
ncbi:type I restriction endonuclease subunit R [Brevibacterium sp. 91QC2O2]|uniref:type I restriction endonuclease subunit R n=1 Tax=Brevibacterium sp. 91QC2O2 TaxID=2968458 RepID=UPI00211C7F0D|nr:type I restriction endonuclease subunit R [Brevibacterium sp. 91QC2O2]MCQ9367139.1 type I restriction endonuclease subunit R [Brevibacterium sp. 91QC2O2]